jgi:hypothetical protein
MTVYVYLIQMYSVDLYPLPLYALFAKCGDFIFTAMICPKGSRLNQIVVCKLYKSYFILQ